MPLLDSSEQKMKGKKRGQDGKQIKRAVVHDSSPEPELEGSTGTMAQFKRGVVKVEINRPQSMRLLWPDVFKGSLTLQLT